MGTTVCKYSLLALVVVRIATPKRLLTFTISPIQRTKRLTTVDDIDTLAIFEAIIDDYSTTDHTLQFLPRDMHNVGQPNARILHSFNC